MARRIIDRTGTTWAVRAVGPIAVGRLQPNMWDLVFTSADRGEPVSVPTTQGAVDIMTDGELIAVLRTARRGAHVAVGGSVLPDDRIEDVMSMGICADPEHVGARAQDFGRRLIPYEGPVYFACSDCLRQLAKERALPAWAPRMMRKAS